jgi:hypothetical protein
MENKQLSVEQLIENRDFAAIDPNRLTDEHLSDIATLINEQVRSFEESVIEEGSPYYEYVASYNYGEATPSFEQLDNDVLANYLEQSFKNYPEETCKLLELYCSVKVGSDFYTSDNVLNGMYLLNSEVEFSLGDNTLLEDLEELFFKLNQEQRDYVCSRIEGYVKVHHQNLLCYTSITGKIEIILNTDNIIEDMINLDEALRLTDNNPVIRGFPVKLLLEDVA